MYKPENQPMRAPSRVSSISALHQFLGLNKPSNPLISVFDFDEVRLEPETILSAITTDFYVVALKKDCAGGKCRYGQQYIEKAKELLSTTEMSVSEIAYHLGFEHSQSFHRLFRNRTSLSPLEFRQSFN